jgi:WD40 repeat protein
MAKVFISYSRKDIEFAKKLADKLQENGLDFWVDWEGIPPTVDWMRQIEKGIEEADTFVFILSPDSVISKVCKEEIEYAVKNGKRLIPIVARDVKGEEAPPALAHLNWLFFRATDDFDASMSRLLTAIQTDYEWVQEQRRLQVKALEWERNHKESSFLLRGKDLSDAELQLAKNTSKEPHPTDLQREFVFKSRQAYDRMRGVVAAITAAGIVALTALAIFGLVMAGRATANAKEARNQASVARTAEANAWDAQAEAKASQEKAEAEARIAKSGRLTLESSSALSEYPQRALLLALEAIRINRDANEPTQSDAEEALRQSMKRVPGIGVPGFSHEVSLVKFTNDNHWLVAGTNAVNGEMKIWDFDRLLDEPGYQPFYLSFPVKYDDSQSNWLPKAYLSPQTTWLVLSGAGDTELWEIAGQDENRKPLTFAGEIDFANAKDDHNILEKQKDKVVLWNVDPYSLTKNELASFTGSFAVFSKDKKYLITDDAKQGLLLWNFASPSTPPILLTPTHAADYKSMLIDPNNHWLILLQDVPRQEFQIQAFDPYGNPTGTTPWSSSDMVLIPLGASKPQVYTAKLDVNVDIASLHPKFSPDGNTLAFVGVSNPDAYGNTQKNFGIVKFIDPTYVYLLSTKKPQEINVLSFIGANWLYVSSFESSTGSQKNILLDLRQEDLFSGTDITTPLLVDGNKDVMFSEDGKSMLSEKGDLIDFAQLDLNHTIVLNPAPEEAPASAQSELLLKLTNDPQSVGLEDTVTVSNQSPDKQWFAAGTRDGSLRLWNNANPWVSTDTHLPAATNYIAFSNDNKWMAVNHSLWQLEDGIPTLSYPIEKDADPLLAVFSPDSRWLVYFQPAADTAEFAFSVKLVDLDKIADDGKVNANTISKSNGIYSVIRFSADSRWVMVEGVPNFSDSIESRSFVYGLENYKNFALPYPVKDFAFASDYMVLVGDDAQSKPEVLSLPATSDQPAKLGEIDSSDPVVVSPDGRWLLTYDSTSTAFQLAALPGKLWDLGCVAEKRVCAPFNLSVNQAGFSPDSLHLIVGYKENSADEAPLDFDIWDLQNLKGGKPVKVYSGKTSQETPSIGRSGNLLVFGPPTVNTAITAAGLFSTWSGYNGVGINVTTYDGYGKLVFGMGGGSEFLAGSFQKDYSVEAFDLGDASQTPAPMEISLRGHESNISASQISPDGKFVLTFSGAERDTGGGAEKLLRLWDVSKLRLDPTSQAVTLPLSLGADGYINALAFSPDSRWVYVIDNTNTLYYFATSVDDLSSAACAAVGRNLIINEWERFFPGKDYRKTCENLPEHPSVLLETTPTPTPTP